jgi:hypothetical protein
VYVPRSVGRIKRVMDFLPRSAAEAVGRLLESDKVVTRADMTGRAAYEERAARSEPSSLETAEGAGEPAERRVA